MTQKPVLKIALPGKNIDSTDIRDFAFHSDYTMLKVGQILSGSISINSGDSSGYVDITHNLGKRAFLVYEDGQLFPSGINSYNDGTKIRITKILDEPYNQTITTYQSDQLIYSTIGQLQARFLAGKVLGNDIESAYWFQTINIAQGQSVTNANFELKNVKTLVGGDTKFKMWGIDEDNTADLNGGYPGGRPKTDAVRTKTQSANTNYFNYGDDITSLVQEIVNRSGWSSGNHMGFMIENNGSDDNRAIYGDSNYSNLNVELKITLTGTGYLTKNYKIVVFKDKIA